MGAILSQLKQYAKQRKTTPLLGSNSNINLHYRVTISFSIKA